MLVLLFFSSQNFKKQICSELTFFVFFVSAVRREQIRLCFFLFAFREFFIHLEQLGNYFAFGHFWGEAVGGHDGAVICLHHRIISITAL